ncbi:hypothetical protein VTJ04DRAFT_4027 [Mycothermus thermophilus]|uniref:uncharacterized protein n=1 Tax=Humicola insolens TaxID=85995 RepID=UPI003742652E
MPTPPKVQVRKVDPPAPDLGRRERTPQKSRCRAGTCHGTWDGIGKEDPRRDPQSRVESGFAKARLQGDSQNWLLAQIRGFCCGFSHFEALFSSLKGLTYPSIRHTIQGSQQYLTSLGTIPHDAAIDISSPLASQPARQTQQRHHLDELYFLSGYLASAWPSPQRQPLQRTSSTTDCVACPSMY